MTLVECDKVPLTPVTVARYRPAVMELHESVELPDPPVTVEDDRLHDKLVELVATLRATLPVKPLSDETVTFEIPLTLTLTVTFVGLETIAKS